MWRIIARRSILDHQFDILSYCRIVAIGLGKQRIVTSIFALDMIDGQLDGVKVFTDTDSLYIVEGLVVAFPANGRTTI